jgi:hypothetical protein
LAACFVSAGQSKSILKSSWYKRFSFLKGATNMNALTLDQQILHQKALLLSRQHREIEGQLISALQRADEIKLFKHFGKTSLFVYVHEVLGFTEAVAYALVSVARTSKAIPELKLAIDNQELTVARASRIVSCLKPENAKELIQYAATHTSRETEREVARRNPKAATRDRVKALSEDHVQLKLTVEPATVEKLRRAQSLEAQKGRNLSLGQTLDRILEVYLDLHDPVRKAERAAKREEEKQAKAKFCARKVEGAKDSQPEKIEPSPIYPRRKKLTAAQRHAVFLRDGGKCTHVDLSGKRCGNDRWLDTHHIHPVHLGGTNDIENLTLLCSFHHDLVHQLSLPIDGAVNWLRSPRIEYTTVGSWTG